MLPRLGGLLLLAGPTMADLASMQNALDTINAGLLKLDKAVVGIPGTLPFLLPLGQAAVPLVINATMIILQSEPLNVVDAASLATSTAALRQNVNLTITDLLGQRPFFQALNQTGITGEGLAMDKSASIALGNALVSKVPDVALQTASQAIEEIFDIYDRGIQLFTNLAADTGVPPLPPNNAAPNPADFQPVELVVPPIPIVQQGSGSVNVDGSCNCAVQCPAGATEMSALTQMTGLTGMAGMSEAPTLNTLPQSGMTGTSGAPALNMLPGASTAGTSGASALNMLPGSSGASAAGASGATPLKMLPGASSGSTGSTPLKMLPQQSS